MPPAVQNLSPAPTKPAARKSSAIADGPQPASVDFREELGRRQRAKRADSRNAASSDKAAKPDKAKRPRPPAAVKRKPGKPNEAPAEDTAPAGCADADSTKSDMAAVQPQPRAQDVNPAPETPDATDSQDKPDPSQPVDVAAAATVLVNPQPVDATKPG